MKDIEELGVDDASPSSAPSAVSETPTTYESRRLMLRSQGGADDAIFLSASTLSDVFVLLRSYRRSELGGALRFVAGGTARGTAIPSPDHPHDLFLLRSSLSIFSVDHCLDFP